MSLIESGTSSIASTWDRYTVAYQNAMKLSTETISYGPNAGTEMEHRLLGPLSGKRFLDLGCGGAQAAIAAAKSGAVSIGVDFSVEQLSFARRLIEQEGTRVELKHGDLAELAFQRADSVDVVFSAFSLQYVADLNRVFRQVHRVLKPQGVLVFSIPHPATSMLSQVQDENAQQTDDPEIISVTRSYFAQTPIEKRENNFVFTEYHRTISDIYMGITRSGYKVDVILEPNLHKSLTPNTLIMRARKEA